jgi:glutamine synthetase
LGDNSTQKSHHIVSLSTQSIIFLNFTNIMKFSAAVFLASLCSAAAFAPSITSRAPTALNNILSKKTGQSALDPSIVGKYDALAFPEDKILAEYVWIDATGNTRSKTRTLPAAKADAVENLPKWNFDGSSTDQAPGDDSEVILYPQALFKDPFRPRSDGARNILVMCDCYTPAGEAIESNSRAFGKFEN